LQWPAGRGRQDKIRQRRPEIAIASYHLKLRSSADFSARQAQSIARTLREPAPRMNNDDPSAEVVQL
jgi:hypothetical protein